MPFTVEMLGRLGKETARFRSDLGDMPALHSCTNKFAFARTVRQQLSPPSLFLFYAVIMCERMTGPCSPWYVLSGGFSSLGWTGQYVARKHDCKTNRWANPSWKGYFKLWSSIKSTWRKSTVLYPQTSGKIIRLFHCNTLNLERVQCVTTKR